MKLNLAWNEMVMRISSQISWLIEGASINRYKINCLRISLIKCRQSNLNSFQLRYWNSFQFIELTAIWLIETNPQSNSLIYCWNYPAFAEFLKITNWNQTAVSLIQFLFPLLQLGYWFRLKFHCGLNAD